ncbi:MAG: hypothetical protein B0A82_01935 [Alkalinema sp. CACIAM 70d]|uniref:hypothetical protein n=1 Tax=Alkalinema sp. FACHB-956 TaxID=2692768 RepID=UPI000B754838|nr:hypothetical protein [Alkalinema sp. FACHB-956]MBD2327366.1 hypothetical protein [Alkalinema sp. FACHB-956]OUC16311.1 MAG: hypothetical protein B0A82_01935 [Alkalinema sp. CACIAM 70d]
MKLRSLLIAGCALLFWGLLTFVAPSAWALTQVALSDLTYHVCPPDQSEGAITSGGVARPANCFIITGKANNTSGKTVVNADVFGRIYDANGDAILRNRARLGSVDEFPPGISEFEIRVSVPESQPEPLKLEQFKAAGFTGKVRR